MAATKFYCKDPELAKRIRRLQAKAWDQGLDEGLKRPRTPSEAWKAPPAPKNPYKGRVKKR